MKTTRMKKVVVTHLMLSLVPLYFFYLLCLWSSYMLVVFFYACGLLLRHFAPNVSVVLQQNINFLFKHQPGSRSDNVI